MTDTPWLGPTMAFDGGELLAIHPSPPYPQFGLAYSVARKPETPERSQRELDDERMDAAGEAARQAVRAQLAAAGIGSSPTKRKRRRRSKEEMIVVRRQAAERIAAARQRAEPEWLAGKDEDAQAFLKSLEET